jgi:hypothetical protein
MLHRFALLVLLAATSAAQAQRKQAPARPNVAGGTDPCATATFLEEPVPDVPGHPDARLRDVVVLDANDAWAVGRASSGSASISVTMRYDGRTWTLVPSPSPAGAAGRSVSLEAVAAVSADEVYAAGTRKGALSATDNFVIRWNGFGWEDLVAPGQSGFGASGYLLEAAAVVGPDATWFGGQWAPMGGTPASMRHWNGSGFEVHLLPLAPDSTTAAHRIRAISVLGPNEIWAAGSRGGSAVAVGKSYVARWDGSSWQHVATPHPGFGEIVDDVVAFASDDVWIVGEYDRIVGTTAKAFPLYLHWDGSAWTQFFPEAFASDLAPLAPDDIWAVRGRDLSHWDGSAWTLQDSLLGATPRAMSAVAAFGRCDLLIVGTQFPVSFLDGDSLALRYR